MKTLLNLVRVRIQRLSYLEKWLLLGSIIGFFSALAALFFLALLITCLGLAAWLLGVVDHPLESTEGDFTIVALSTERRFIVPLLVLVGAMLSGLIVYRFEPSAEGAGTNAAIRAYHRGATLSFRVPIVKAVASALFLGFGGSGGVQGPGIQIGAGVGSSIARILKLSVEDRRLAIVAGIAGALSAIFRSPIGAALFAVEVLYRRDIETEALAPAIISSAISFVVASYVIGYKGVFPQIDVSITNIFQPIPLASIFLLGIVTALVARVYITLFSRVRRMFIDVERVLGSKHRWLKPVVGACVVAAVGIVVPVALGGGVLYAARIVEYSIRGNEEELDILGFGILLSLSLLIALKMIATVFSVGSGGSGGLFAPSIFIGTALGYLYGKVVHSFTGLPPYIYAYIGMASFFGAATKTPIASSFMIAEMSGSYPLLIPTLIASLIANEIVRGRTLYEAQIAKRVRPELTTLNMLLDTLREDAELRNLRVSDVVNEEYVPIDIDESVSKAVEIMAKYRQRILPVIDKQGIVRGALDSATLRKALDRGVSIPIAYLELANPPLVHREEVLSRAVEKMLHKGYDYAIVVDESQKYVGVLLAEDITITLAHHASQKQ